MARIRSKTITQTVARDTKTGRYVKLSTRPSKRIVIQTIRIPTRTLFGYGQTA